MPVEPSLVVAASRQVWLRLRSDAGARALAVADDAAIQCGAVRWIPLLDGDLEADEERSDAAWSVRLRPVAATPQAPMAVLWVAERQGEARQLLEAMGRLGDRMLGLLQHDRVPPRVAAVIYVAKQGLSLDDAEVLEAVSDPGSAVSGIGALPVGQAEMVGSGRAVYLMSRRTRVGAEGSSWAVGDVWPIEVGRLLASLECAPGRQRGLRAWRSMRFNPSRYPYDKVELEAFRFAREAIGLPPDGDAPVVEGSGRQLQVSRPPESVISRENSPMHCRDLLRGGGTRPELPDWWELAATSVREASDRRTDTSGSRRGARSEWYQRFDDRGRVFIDDRARQALKSLEETMGPRAIQTQAWRTIHGDPGVLAWFASGQFYVGPEPGLDGVADGLRAWSKLSEFERRAISARRKALAEGAELDVARSHFVRVGWRFACALAASLFVATVFSSLFAGAGWRWALAMSSAAFGGAVIASILVLWLEVRAGNRARGSIELTVRGAEDAIAQSFLERMRLGSEGERLGRRRRWFQAAARVRDSAMRLKAIQDLAELRALRQSSADAPTLAPALREYSASTTVEAVDDTLPVDSLRDAVRRDSNDLVRLRARNFENWWGNALQSEDPFVTGAVRRRVFEPRVAEEIASVIDAFRGDLMAVIDEPNASMDADWASQARFSVFLGSAGDLRNLGVQTERAQGRDLRRVVWVLCMLRRHAERSSAIISRQFGQGISAQAIQGSVDRWGAFGLMIDDVAIGFRRGAADVMCVDPELGVCVFEGADRGRVSRAEGRRP